MKERINLLRKKMGLSQEELANKIGVSRQAVSKWESGQSMPDLDKIIALSDLFGVSTDYILKGTDVSYDEGTLNAETTKKIMISGAIIFALLTLIIAFSLNRFRDVEILMLTLCGGVIGYFAGYILGLVYSKKNKSIG